MNLSAPKYIEPYVRPQHGPTILNNDCSSSKNYWTKTNSNKAAFLGSQPPPRLTCDSTFQVEGKRFAGGGATVGSGIRDQSLVEGYGTTCRQRRSAITYSSVVLN